MSLLQALQKSEGLQKRSTVLAEEVGASFDTAIAGKRRETHVAKVLEAYAQTGAHCKNLAGDKGIEGDPNFIGHYRMSLRTCEKKWDDDDKCVAFEYNYKVSKRCILTKAVTLVWYQLQGHRGE